MTSGAFYFDPSAKGLEVFLGPTEARLMELSWKHHTLTVKKARFYLNQEGNRAYTTIMTILNRLATKGLLERKKTQLGGRSFEYVPAISRNDFIKGRVLTVSRCLKQFK